MRKLYEIVGLGGTFDRFHVGHEHFIKFASQFGQHVHIGITHPKLTQGKYLAEIIESYETRKRAVIKFCKSQQISGSVMELTDPYGPTLEKKSKIKALVVTEDTVSGSNKINQTRSAMDLHQLPVQVCPLLKDKMGKIISSERIRVGEINRAGKIYQQVFKQNLILTNKQRDFFSQPQGEMVTQPVHYDNSLVCIVGDNSLEKFIQESWHYDLAIYDQRRQRQLVKSIVIDSIKPNLKTQNQAGQISTSLVKNIKLMLTNNYKYLLVDGEEDLAAVALIMITPLKTRIYYGQPQQGLVMIEVTEQLKENVYHILNKN